MLAVVVNVASPEEASNLVEDFIGVLSLSQLNVLGVGHGDGSGGAQNMWVKMLKRSKL